MFPHAETYYAALKAEHAAMLQHAERRALVEAATRLRSIPALTPSEPAAARWARLARAIRSLRWALRPSHA